MNPHDVEKYLRAKLGDIAFERLYKRMNRIAGRTR